MEGLLAALQHSGKMELSWSEVTRYFINHSGIIIMTYQAIWTPTLKEQTKPRIAVNVQIVKNELGGVIYLQLLGALLTIFKALWRINSALFVYQISVTLDGHLPTMTLHYFSTMALPSWFHST